VVVVCFDFSCWANFFPSVNHFHHHDTSGCIISFVCYREVLSEYPICGRTVCGLLWSNHRKQYVLFISAHRNIFLNIVVHSCWWPLCVFSVTAFTKSTRVNSQEYEVKVVDTAGQDEYSIFPNQYSMDIHGYVLVYSITSNKSFEVVQVIYDKLLDSTGKVQ